MNMLKAVYESMATESFSLGLTPVHARPTSVSLAVICKGPRVPEAHHGAAQGERLRLRDL